MPQFQPLDIVIVDSDAFIAYFDAEDVHAPRTLELLEMLAAQEVTLLYPATTIAEATTALQRRLKKPIAAAQLIAQVKAHEFVVEPVDADILDAAAVLFKPHGSKKNTIFDAIVAALAQKHHAQAIFSFDDWYEKVGLRLVGSQI
jgi:predicted nucleic acid-binding protein